MPRGERRSQRLSTEMFEGPATRREIGVGETSWRIISINVYVLPVYRSDMSGGRGGTPGGPCIKASSGEERLNLTAPF